MGSGIRYLLQHAKAYFAAFLKSILCPGDTKIGLQESLDLKTVPKVSPFSSINELTDPFFSWFLIVSSQFILRATDCRAVQ